MVTHPGTNGSDVAQLCWSRPTRHHKAKLPTSETFTSPSGQNTVNHTEQQLYWPAHEKRDVEERRVVVDKLQEVQLQRHAVVVVGLCTPTLPVSQKHCQPPINLQQ